MNTNLIEIGDCWHWVGSGDAEGYGYTAYRGKVWKAHRAAWDALVGPIPDGLVIDHLCRNPSCVNPDHLEPVTQRDNVHRGQAVKPRNVCKNGLHDLTVAENVYSRPDGTRQCQPCRRAAAAAYKKRKRVSAA